MRLTLQQALICKGPSLVSISDISSKNESICLNGESICLKIRDNDLALVENTKYLGVQVDNSLDWKEHI